MDISVALIAAVARNGAIGKDNGLPWRLSGDLRFFKQITMGKPVVMGRKTFESIGRPLPGRNNIVITRNASWQANGVEVVASLQAGLSRARKWALKAGAAEVMVIGGAQIYRLALPLAARLYITEVDAEVDADAFFPKLDDSWVEIVRECYPASDRNEYNYALVQYDRFK
ncbi:dihydrofolate reductase [uncultured Microbulbifer sp.]|uniref:dihydrofolate reductase n=1 Tax=uncultured Microbulbifer sp. TaxID=348147 RepID=UPI002601E02E|nr:dihydrofolate reductase [uncultured Microbulbifer sp.]